MTSKAEKGLLSGGKARARRASTRALQEHARRAM